MLARERSSAIEGRTARDQGNVRLGSSLNRNLDNFTITRRQFMQALGVAAGTLAASPLGALAGTPNPPQARKVIIVGAGVAGLCAAYELEQLGHQTVVLEAHPSRVGGRVFTRRFGDGQYGELGAMRIPQHHELTRHYVSLFGLPVRTFVQSDPEAYYYVRGHRVKIKDEGMLNQYLPTAPRRAEQVVVRPVVAVGPRAPLRLEPEEIANCGGRRSPPTRCAPWISCLWARCSSGADSRRRPANSWG